jgi:hypothetical protein
MVPSIEIFSCSSRNGKLIRTKPSCRSFAQPSRLVRRLQAARAEQNMRCFWFSYREGRWAMGDGRWAMGNGRWVMGNGRWVMGNGQWAMGDGLFDFWFAAGCAGFGGVVEWMIGF